VGVKKLYSAEYEQSPKSPQNTSPKLAGNGRAVMRNCPLPFTSNPGLSRIGRHVFAGSTGFGTSRFAGWSNGF
jgi:hypothetical protein